MAQSHGVLIIGGGHAAVQAAQSLRQGGYGEPIRIISNEPVAPYQRPPLSKSYLLGELEADRLPLKPDAFYAENNIELTLDTLVSAIEPDKGRVRIERRGARSEHIAFSKLILATGARAITPNLPNDERALNGWFTLRTRADSDALGKWMERPRNAVVVGGGYIGLEVAAALSKSGGSVTVLEAAPRLLSRVSGEEVAAFYAREHAERGVEMRFSTSAFGLFGDVRVDGVRAGGGAARAERIDANLVVFGMGVRPNVELAQSAGIPCEDGVMTDEAGRTAHPDVYAIGDCARAWNRIFRRPLRLESVQNAIDGAKACAAAILDQPAPAAHAPWNWSDQYDIKLQTAGISAGADATVMRGDPDSGSFAVFYLRAGELVACDAINAPPEFLAARQMITRRAKPTPEMLRDTSTPMKTLAAAV